MIFSSNLDPRYPTKSKFQKLQEISVLFNQKLYFLTLRSAPNNFYLTVTDKFGSVFSSRSGGSIKSAGLKRNTSYSFESVLGSTLKHLVKIKASTIIVRLDLLSLKRKKLITAFVHRYGFKVLYMQLRLSPALNGVRLVKKRRV